MPVIMSVVPGMDDEIWEAVPEDPGPPPDHLVEFVRGLARAEHALDLGCGDGRLTAELNAGEVTAADVSQVALDRAGGRVPAARLVLLEPDRPLPFGDAELDLVLCAETIEHVRDTQLLLSEIRRVLRPGGRLAVTTPAGSRWRVLLFGLEHPFSPHLRTFTRRSLRMVLDAMAFQVLSLEVRRGTLMALAVR
jgi:SAM-dependent methyltransferase